MVKQLQFGIHPPIVPTRLTWLGADSEITPCTPLDNIEHIDKLAYRKIEILTAGGNF